MGGLFLGREVPSSKNQKSRDFVGDLLIPAFMLCFLPDLQVGQTWRNHRGWLEKEDAMRKKVPWGRKAIKNCKPTCHVLKSKA